MNWFMDIFLIIGGICMLVALLKEKEQLPARERWLAGVTGGLWSVFGGASFIGHLGWRVLPHQVEHFFTVQSRGLPWPLLIPFWAFILCRWWRRRKERRASPAPPRPSAIPTPGMKVCAYCGRENDESATHCVECGTERFKGDAPLSPPSQEPLNRPPEKRGPSFVFAPLTAADMEKDWVTLLKCGTLFEADMAVSQLTGAGLTAFIPDQFLMQNAGLGLTYGFFRVQVAPKDYETAKELLLTLPVAPPPAPRASAM